VAHLGRLAIDNGAKGQGLGKALLIDALRRIENISEQLGIYAVEVYALNDPAKKFYLRFGFSELADDRFHLYLSIKTIRKLFL
jgi:ribosomal protein S18 acetylase RimI-like enzyme